MSADNIEKAPDAYRTISEVADDLDIPQHVLRFWETRFSQIRPLKRGGGRRYYRPEDVALIKGIRALLYGQGYTIKGVQRILRDQGLKQVQALGRGGQGAEPAKADLVLEAAPAPEAEADDVDAAVYPDDIDHGDSVEADTRPPLRAPAAADAEAGAGRIAHLSGGQGGVDSAPSLPPALAGESRRRLEAALAELTACRRMIAAARENA